MTSEAATTIGAGPDVVYALVADVTRMGEWSPETRSAEWLDEATRAVPGARFKGRNKRRAAWSTACTVTEAEPGRAFAFDVGKGETRWRYSFEPAGDGTRVQESFTIVRCPGAIARLLTWVGTGVRWSDRDADLVWGMEATLASLKRVAEAQLHPPT